MGLIQSRPIFLHSVDKYEFCRMVLRDIRSRPLVRERLSMISKDTYNDLEMAIIDSYVLAIRCDPTDLPSYVAGTADIMADDIMEVKFF